MTAPAPQRANSEAVLAGAEQAAGLKDSGVRYTKEVRIGPIGDLFMGSVAMKVLHFTRLPVLLVR